MGDETMKLWTVERFGGVDGDTDAINCRLTGGVLRRAAGVGAFDTLGTQGECTALMSLVRNNAAGQEERWLLAAVNTNGVYDMLARYLPRDAADTAYPAERSWHSIRGTVPVTGGDYRHVNYEALSQPVVVLANGVDPVCVWKGAGTLEKLTPSAPSAPVGGLPAILMDRLWLAGVAGMPQSVYYSEVLDPTGWTMGTNRAGYLNFLTWDGDTVRAIVPVQMGLLVFKTRSVWRLTSGSPRLMQKLQANTPWGVEGAGCVCAWGLQVYYLCADGLQRWAGGEGAPYLREELADFWAGVDQARLGQARLIAHRGRLWAAVYGNAASTGRDTVLEVELATGAATVRRGLPPVGGWLAVGDRLLYASGGVIFCLGGADDTPAGPVALRWRRRGPTLPTGQVRVRQVIVRGSGGQCRVTVTADGQASAVIVSLPDTEGIETAWLEATGRLVDCTVENVEGSDIAVRQVTLGYEEVAG